MRHSAVLLVCGLVMMTGASHADEAVAVAVTGLSGGTPFNTSLSLNLPLVATDPAGRTAEEDGYRKDLYLRAVRECAVLLESVAKTCTITGVNVSTQINSNAGQPDYLYISANIAMQVDLK